MADCKPARREPFRQRQTQRAEAQEIAGAMEEQRFVRDRQAKRNADAAANIFLEPCRPGKALRRTNDLPKAPAARADATPDLATARGVLGHGYSDPHARLAAGRQS